MTQKKKLSREEKKQRRLKEMQKAASRVDTRVTLKTAEVSDKAVSSPGKSLEKSQEKYSLPIKEIKSDLWKNLGFTVFAVCLVVVLKVTGFGFQEIKHLLNL